MQVLTSVERLVLESLGNSPKDLKALMTDTRLELRFLANIIHALTLRGYIVASEGGYIPNVHLPAKELACINDETSRRHEAIELIEGMAVSNENNLGMRKAWVSEKDRKVLNAILRNLEDFMRTLPPPPKGTPLHDYTLVVWGEDKYGSVVQRLIGGVL